MDYSEQIGSYKHVSNFSMCVKIQLFEVGAYRSDFLSVGTDEQRSVQRKSQHERRIGRSHYAQCCTHKARTPRRPQESYTYCCQEVLKVR